jgi:hypothetical protein
MNRKRFNKLMRRLSAGELTAAERRELDELCAADEALRAEARQTKAILASAHGARPEQPSDFEWAAFSTRLRATIEAERPRPYGRVALWLERLAGEFKPVQVAAAALAVVVAVATLLVVEQMLQPGTSTPPGGNGSGGPIAALPEPEWQWDDIEAHYELAVVLPNADLVRLEGQVDDELDEVRQIIDATPEPNGDDNEIVNDIIGQDT